MNPYFEILFSVATFRQALQLHNNSDLEVSKKVKNKKQQKWRVAKNLNQDNHAKADQLFANKLVKFRYAEKWLW